MQHSFADFFQSPRGDLVVRDSDSPTLEIVPVSLGKPFQKYSYIRRYFQEIEYAERLATQILSFAPNVVILSNIPPEAQSSLYRRLSSTNIHSVFWVQDIYSTAIKRILRQKTGPVGQAIGNYYAHLEKQVMQQSDAIVVITDDFLEPIQQWHVPLEKVHVIPNWAPIESIPVHAKYNGWSVRHNLADKFVFLYTGTLGMKHNPSLLLKLALRFENNPEVYIVVVSEGLGADWLRQKKQELALHRMLLMDFQPFIDYPKVLASADVLVAILEVEAGGFSVPSKVLSYLCAERPLLLAVPEENLAAKIVYTHEAGLVSSPGNEQDFVECAQKLYLDKSLCKAYGENARNYAVANFRITHIGDRFEEIIYRSMFYQKGKS